MSAVFEFHDVPSARTPAGPEAALGLARVTDPANAAPAATPCVTAHEFWLPGRGEAGRTGVLLVHGMTGTPNEMRMLGKGLNRAGFSVYGMQLAGHCGSMDDLLQSHWQDWAASVRAAAVRLHGEVDRLVVMGLSMGAVLALDLAADPEQRVAGVGALSTMFWHDGWSIPLYTRLSFLLKPFRLLGIGRRKVFMEQPPYGIKDDALRQRVVAQMQSGDSSAAGLPGNPWYSIIEMRDLSVHVRRRLGRITAPCLAIHASNDDISSVANARLIQRKVQGLVEVVLLDDSYHMITIDRERRTVTAKAVAFLQRIAELPPQSPLATCAMASSPQRAALTAGGDGDAAPGLDALAAEPSVRQRWPARLQGCRHRPAGWRWSGALEVDGASALAVGGHRLLCCRVPAVAGLFVAGAIV